MIEIQIEVKNNLSQVWVTYKAKFGTPAKLMEWKGIDLGSFIRFKDKWKIASIVYESE